MNSIIFVFAALCALLFGAAGYSVYDQIVCPGQVAKLTGFNEADIESFLSASSFDCRQIEESKAVQLYLKKFISGDYKIDTEAKSARNSRTAVALSAAALGVSSARR